jgi:hypothetical protein
LYTFSTLNTLERYFIVWPNRPDLLAKIQRHATSEGLKEYNRAKHEFRYSCTECPNPVIFASKSGLLGHTIKYLSSVFKVENVYN